MRSSTPRASCDPRRRAAHFRLTRAKPAEDLAHLIERHWMVEWDLDEPFTQEIVTHPSVNIAFEDAADHPRRVHRPLPAGADRQRPRDRHQVPAGRLPRLPPGARAHADRPGHPGRHRLRPPPADHVRGDRARPEARTAGPTTRASPRSARSTPRCSRTRASPASSTCARTPATPSARSSACSASTSASRPSGCSTASACTRRPSGWPTATATGRAWRWTSATSTRRTSSRRSRPSSAARPPIYALRAASSVG